MAELAQLVQRLEAVATRLEAAGGRGGGVSVNSTPGKNEIIKVKTNSGNLTLKTLLNN